MWQFVLIMITYVILKSSRGDSYYSGIEESSLICGASQRREWSASKFNAIMDTVSFQVKDRGWGAETLLGSGSPVYALGQCRGDLRPMECYTCFTRGRLVLSRCLPKTAGRVYLDGCFLRYDNYSFFREAVDPTRDIHVCTKSKPGLKRNGDRGAVATAVAKVTKGAAERGFAVVGGEGVFALAQCWGTLDGNTCEGCLSAAGRKVQECVPNAEGRSLFTGCILRYSTHNFYNDSLLLAPPQPHVKDSTNSREEPSTAWRITACVFIAIVGLLLIVIATFTCRKRIASRRKVSDNSGAASPSFAYMAGFSFRYDLLEMATNYFDPANKLGQGGAGAGSVFKGTLPSGRTVAVKRLIFNTQQCTEGFFNLINGIQHKNLVKLLGCSIQGPDTLLLVYEFVPNGSLDQVLFGRDSENALNWEQRFRIIRGIAEGLAYLHGGSGTKIIHGDIKSSNILLDENLNPKIADCGLAPSVAENKSHLSTGDAGTLGYMAPEIVINGQLTEKEDIYAFGVLVVEIVCGKKNSDYKLGSTSVLHSVWKNYQANNITASVDPTLHGKFKVEEASNALEAGLLCTQSSDSLRPSMSEVVQMLIKKDYVIPYQKQKFSGHASARSSSSFRSAVSSLNPND